MKILLIATYEMGRQPFGIASPAAVLSDAGHDIACLDLSVQQLDEAAVRNAQIIAFHLPMHTATRIALAAIDKVRAWNAAAHLCAYGLYAPVSSEILRGRGVATILGGEFEAALLRLVDDLDAGRADSASAGGASADVPLERQRFAVPRRDLLPPLSEYAHLMTADGVSRTVGYTEASRGCKHLCRHCPVVPVYKGRFRAVPVPIVLADIDQQVDSGAQHITFGDPDFFNGPAHAVQIVRRLHEAHPELSYDVTVKIEHLLQHDELLPVLRDTGCAFVTSAVESVDDEILEKLDKGHTAAGFEQAVHRCNAVGLALQPTFVAFNPWITLQGYEQLLATIARLGLVDNVPSIQLAIRLLIPAGSRLLELDEVQQLVGPFDAGRLGYPWVHPDPRVDALQRDVEALVEQAGEDAGRSDVFALAWQALQAANRDGASALPLPPLLSRAAIPYLSEPWYC